MATIIRMGSGLSPKNNIRMTDGSPVQPALAADRSIAQAFVADYRKHRIRATGPVRRLAKRQAAFGKKVKRSEKAGAWFGRLVDSNNMRAALLASTL